MDNHNNGSILSNVHFQKLPLWNGGKNHVIIEFGSAIRYNRDAIGIAIIASQYIQMTIMHATLTLSCLT